MNDVAEHAGVALSTLYRRFSGREDLVRAVFQRYVTEEAEPLVAAAVTHADPWQALVAGLEATVLTVADNAALLQAARDSALITSAAASGFLRPLVPALRRAQDAGHVRPDVTADDLPALIAMVVTTMWRCRRTVWPGRRTAVVTSPSCSEGSAPRTKTPCRCRRYPARVPGGKRSSRDGSGGAGTGRDQAAAGRQVWHGR